MARGKRHSEGTGRVVEELEIVDRPMSARDKWALDREIRELSNTMESGKAVRLRISDQADLHKIHMALRYAATRKLKARFRYKTVDDHTIIAWAEKRRD